MDTHDLTLLTTLLPCKKCGYPYGRFISYGTISIYQKPEYRISCPNCSYCTKVKKTPEEARAAWNQRG